MAGKKKTKGTGPHANKYENKVGQTKPANKTKKKKK